MAHSDISPHEPSVFAPEDCPYCNVHEPNEPCSQHRLLPVGARVKFAEERQAYTVRATTRNGRFAILTKPFNPRSTVLYTVVDFQRGVRGTDNYRGLGYESDGQVAAAVHEFQHTEDADPPEVTNNCTYDGVWCLGGAEVSLRTRNHIPLRIVDVRTPRPSGGAA